ncbi:uncharacterized protein LOC143890503 isoform X2 [Tasmannia lanceolata]|uniref:uncharacterized protein LOC143890503 isoform X2 n=1 Tax=Tasmannia lanceolata TaxID=3420 RepID=UPI004062DB21
MENAKRWTVTYTRHIKQKRKVYQDGALELGSTGKVMLFDDCEKLLHVRFLKKEEVVESGATLEFDTYLVDIGDLEGNYKHLSNSNVQGKDKESVEKTRMLQQKDDKKTKLRSTGALQNHPSVLSNAVRENRKNGLQNIGAPQNRPNMSQSSARDSGNKQTGLQGIVTQQNHPNATQTTVTEWHALYTTQITQKAKKYHDGILRLSFSGSHRKQVLLYDDFGKLLDSRFLKKEEMVESGGTLTFDTCLVDIGDFQGKDKESVEKTRALRQKENKKSELGSIRSLKNHPIVLQNTGRENNNTELQSIGAQQNRPNMTQNTAREYKKSELPNSGRPHNWVKTQTTVQGNRQTELQDSVTQHNHPNATQNTVTEWHALYTTQITQKAKKYHDGILRLSFCGSHRKQVSLLNEDGTILGSKYVKLSEYLTSGSTYQLPNYLIEIGERRTFQIGENQNDASSRQIVGSYSCRSDAEKLKITGTVPRKKLLRDAGQILSFLKIPTAQETFAPGQDAPETKYSKRSIKHNCEDDCQITTQISTSGSDLSQVKAALEFSSSGFMKSVDPEHIWKLSPDNFFSSSKRSLDSPKNSQRHGTRPASTSNSTNCGDSSSRASLFNSLNENPQVEESFGIASEENHHPNVVLCDTTDENKKLPGSRINLMKIPKVEKDENSNQICVDNVDANTEKCEEASTLDPSLCSSDPLTCAATSSKEGSFEDFKSLSDKSKDFGEIPRFDLGMW